LKNEINFVSATVLKFLTNPLQIAVSGLNMRFSLLILFSWYILKIIIIQMITSYRYFQVVGTLVMAMGIWLRTDSRFRDFLSERYRQAVHEAFWEAPTLYAFSYILIILGACLILVAMFGCCGAISNSSLLLGIYGIGTFLLLDFTIGCGSFIVYTKDSVIFTQLVELNLLMIPVNYVFRLMLSSRMH
jgi:hypothetical protein